MCRGLDDRNGVTEQASLRRVETSASKPASFHLLCMDVLQEFLSDVFHDIYYFNGCLNRTKWSFGRIMNSGNYIEIAAEYVKIVSIIPSWSPGRG